MKRDDDFVTYQARAEEIEAMKRSRATLLVAMLAVVAALGLAVAVETAWTVYNAEKVEAGQ